MKYRKFGRTGWSVSEVGYGMWGMAGWQDSEENESFAALDAAVESGCTFFDTAWGYGEGLSERFLGQLVKRHPDKKLYLASKIPPKNFTWPSKSHFKLEDCFPSDHIIQYTHKTLKNLGQDTIDLMQFHVWEDSWAKDEKWQRTVEDLIKQGKIRSMGISVNRWEPNNGLETLKTGLIDAVQVIYNIFDQAPEDQLFPLCKELDIAVIARVPFDEGTLTGNLTLDTKFPEGDWRGTYFVPENLKSSVEHAEKLKPLVPPGMTMAEMALRFILANETVSTTIPGMRKMPHVKSNLASSDGKTLPQDLLEKLKQHRWDREPTEWSQ
jgi:aryl-alcohol dehydrogenase-like predicted oxidoreductase